VLLDGFTIIAQFINFLILLFLLRRFLYRPILNAMEERERTVAERLESAEQKRIQAEQERQLFHEKNRELREQTAEKQRQAEEEVEEWHRKALQAAHNEIEHTTNDWRQSIAQEQASFAASLRQFAVHQTYEIARKSIRDLANSTLEEQMVTAFLSRLNHGEVDLTPLNKYLQNTDNARLTVRSAFELSPDMKHQIQQDLQAHFKKDLSLEFSTAPALAAGIELVGEDGHQVAWNLVRYLEAIEEELAEQLEEQMGAQAGVTRQMEVENIGDS
jgi:F-type H+-transporting ATPase subunit b